MTVTIQPKPISQPRPAYPPVARRRGLDGKVVLDVTVSADGTVRKVAVSHSSSSSLLDEAAIASVWTWRFQPGQVGGKAKEMTIPLSIEFRLR
ncbi:MAG: energy transducer TonB [Desulfobulbaceae bacterium]|jgi:protein TonB|nr:energy transducer TonB [Desulfobulbaceae bacterium]